MAYIEGFRRTFKSAAALSKGQLVGVDTAAELVVSSGPTIGFADRPAAIGDLVTVLLHHPTREAIADDAISIGSRVTQTATGKVDNDVAGEWIALNAASADGDVIEVARIIP